MVVLWGPQCNPMSPIYIKMSKFLNFLLAFIFSKFLNNQKKLTEREGTLQATSKIACGCLGVPSRPGGGRDQKYFSKMAIHRKLCRNFFLEFSPPISDICQLPHFCPQLNLQFSELNIMPSARQFSKLLKLNIYLQTIIIGKKPQFELNLRSFK